MTYRSTAAFAAGWAATLAAGNAWSAPPPATELADMVVTATRTPQAESDTLAATSVITRDDIERRQPRTLADLLERTPSLAITNNGGPGKQTSIFLRGMDNNQVLVLVDGVRWGSATSGQAAIADFPVDQIQRIEIVRGPRSALYGADAAGGVIQIFTRDGRDADGAVPRPYGHATVGSYGTYEGQAGLAGRSAQASYNLSVSGQSIDGFNACTGRPFGAPGGGAGCFADQPDDDGYDRVDGSANLGYTFDNGWDVSGHYLRAEADTEFDGSQVNQSHSVQEIYGLAVEAPLTDIWRSTLSVSRSRDLSTNDFDGAFVSRFDTDRSQLSWQNDIVLAADQLATLGIDHRRDEVSGSIDYAETKRTNTGLFGEYQGRFGAHEISLAARGDDNQAYGDHATGSVTYGYHIDEVYLVTAAYGNAFTAPTFNDLYYPTTPGFADAANPDLEPERSRTAELGLKARPRWGRWSVHAYETRVTDQIELNADFTPVNLSAARIRGVEAEATAYVGRWRFETGGYWLDTKNEADNDNYGNDLARRPGYSASLALDRDIGARFAAGATAELVGSRYNDPANTNELGGYALFGLRGEAALSDAWQLKARLSNLFDRDYQTIDFYNQPGRAVYVTLRYAPGG